MAKYYLWMRRLELHVINGYTSVAVPVQPNPADKSSQSEQSFVRQRISPSGRSG
jgi:hypothetical protein